MCGIVGLLIKKPELQSSLGRWLVPMFDCLADRGPDSAGLAVFSTPLDGPARRFSLFAPSLDFDWRAVLEELNGAACEPCELVAHGNHALLTSAIDPSTLATRLAAVCPEIRLLSAGRSVALYKDAGHPREIANRYQFARLAGTHAVGHTRMATESAVSPEHAHPFSAGEDFCLVHNGSLSNPYSLRRALERKGVRFETDNDTEAACRLLEWRMREGDALVDALAQAFRDLDGFYTLLIATGGQMVLVRDAFACKPAVVAETDDYVAVGSEFRSLAHLPGVENALIYEPMPQQIYSWNA